MSTRLDAYLALERVMLELDAVGDRLADDIRDMMDPIWYQLSEEEVRLLNARGNLSGVSLHPIRFPAADVWIEPDESPWSPTNTVHDKRVGVKCSKWEIAA
jgi:hypothetical protein